jgi:hypothetical protein
VPHPLQWGDKIDILSLMPPALPSVYVWDIRRNKLTLVTAKGHPEAGAIRFGVDTVENGNLEVKIESEARPSSDLSNMLYEQVGKPYQTLLWVHFLDRAATLSGGHMASYPPLITTEVSTARSHLIAPSRRLVHVLNGVIYNRYR